MVTNNRRKGKGWRRCQSYGSIEYNQSMPTISEFYGIKITMNYNDHLPPHFHAEYQDDEAILEIRTGAVTGRLPRRALNLIWAWLDEHREELFENWTRAQQRLPLNRIDPLP